MLDYRILEYDWTFIARALGYSNALVLKCSSKRRSQEQLRGSGPTTRRMPADNGGMNLMRLRRSDANNEAQAIVARARRSARYAFPNPTRDGCPDSSLLRRMAYRDREVDPAGLPISHVAGCSPCFQEYMRQRRNAKFVSTLRWTVASVVAVSVVLGAFVLLRSHLRPGIVGPVATGQHKGEPEQRTHSTPRLPATENGPILATIDLGAHSPTRGLETSTRSNDILLPAKWIRASLILPIGSDLGEYQIRLLTSREEVLLDTRAVSRRSQGMAALQIDLHLEELSDTRLKLMIRPPGLSWRTFRIRTAAARPLSGTER